MAVRPEQDPFVASYAGGFVIGGAIMIAGALSRWISFGGIGGSAGIDFGEGRIILTLGVIAVFLGLIAAFNRTVTVEVFVAAIGCALAAAVLSLAAREINYVRSVQGAPNAFVIATLAEGPWVVLAGGIVVGLSSIACLGRALHRLSTESTTAP